MDITLKEVEVTKLNLQPGETLVVSVYSDMVDNASAKSLAEGFKQKFPNNEVAILVLGQNDKILFSVMTAPAANTSLSCASSPVGYCSDCNCGKREAVENG